MNEESLEWNGMHVRDKENKRKKEHTVKKMKTKSKGGCYRKSKKNKRNFFEKLNLILILSIICRCR